MDSGRWTGRRRRTPPSLRRVPAIRKPSRLLIVVLVAALLALAGCGGDDDETGAATDTTNATTDTGDGDAYINVSTGVTNGVPPDDRAGTPPPSLKAENLKTAARQAGCELRLDLKDEGHTHVESPVKYGTNPPTSGNHDPIPQADGAYLEMPPAPGFVHSLEHGRLEIQYRPELPEEDQLALKGLYDTEYAGALLFPNDEMPYAVAATTWTNLLGCKAYRGAATLEAIRAFGKQTWGRFGGEPVDIFGPLTGPRPRDPE
jgi:hypothetical protein